MGSINIDDVKKVAKLANIPLDAGDADKFTGQFSQTLETIDLINKLDTSGVEPTSQVTQLTNRLREDEIDQTRILTQEQALSNAPSTYDGYFKVPAILNQE